MIWGENGALDLPSRSANKSQVLGARWAPYHENLRALIKREELVGVLTN